MAKKEYVRTVITCDMCGQECNPVRQINLAVGSTTDFTNYIVLSVRGDFPYATSNGDICKACLGKALTAKKAEHLLD